MPILYFQDHTVYPKKYAHGFVVLCFVVVMQSFIMNSHEVFIHIHQGCFAGTGAIVRLPQCQWSKPDGYGKISQCITTTKHSKAKTVCIFLGIYCIYYCLLLLSGGNPPKGPVIRKAFPYHDVTMWILFFQRRIHYYFVNIMLPCFMLSVLVLVAFCIPPEAGEKISCGISVLLAFTVFLLMVSETVPKTSLQMPVIGNYPACLLLTHNREQY